MATEMNKTLPPDQQALAKARPHDYKPPQGVDPAKYHQERHEFHARSGNNPNNPKAAEDHKKWAAWHKQRLEGLKKDDMPHPAGSPEAAAHDVKEKGESVKAAAGAHHITGQKFSKMLTHLRSLKSASDLRSPENAAAGHPSKLKKDVDYTQAEAPAGWDRGSGPSWRVLHERATAGSSGSGGAGGSTAGAEQTKAQAAKEGGQLGEVGNAGISQGAAKQFMAGFSGGKVSKSQIIPFKKSEKFRAMAEKHQAMVKSLDPEQHKDLVKFHMKKAKQYLKKASKWAVPGEVPPLKKALAKACKYMHKAAKWEITQGNGTARVRKSMTKDELKKAMKVHEEMAGKYNGTLAKSGNKMSEIEKVSHKTLSAYHSKQAGKAAKLLKKAERRGSYPQGLASENIEAHMERKNANPGKYPGGAAQAKAIGISQARRGEHEPKLNKSSKPKKTLEQKAVKFAEKKAKFLRKSQKMMNLARQATNPIEKQLIQDKAAKLLKKSEKAGKRIEKTKTKIVKRDKALAKAEHFQKLAKSAVWLGKPEDVTLFKAQAERYLRKADKWPVPGKVPPARHNAKPYHGMPATRAEKASGSSQNPAPKVGAVKPSGDAYSQKPAPMAKAGDVPVGDMSGNVKEPANLKSAADYGRQQSNINRTLDTSAKMLGGTAPRSNFAPSQEVQDSNAARRAGTYSAPVQQPLALRAINAAEGAMDTVQGGVRSLGAATRRMMGFGKADDIDPYLEGQDYADAVRRKHEKEMAIQARKNHPHLPPLREDGSEPEGKERADWHRAKQKEMLDYIVEQKAKLKAAPKRSQKDWYRHHIKQMQHSANWHAQQAEEHEQNDEALKPQGGQDNLNKAAPKGVDEAKYKRCKEEVKRKSGDKVNPYAVCAASLKKATEIMRNGSQPLEKASIGKIARTAARGAANAIGITGEPGGSIKSELSPGLYSQPQPTPSNRAESFKLGGDTRGGISQPQPTLKPQQKPQAPGPQAPGLEKAVVDLKTGKQVRATQKRVAAQAPKPTITLGEKQESAQNSKPGRNPSQKHEPGAPMPKATGGILTGKDGNKFGYRQSAPEQWWTDRLQQKPKHYSSEPQKNEAKQSASNPAPIQHKSPEETMKANAENKARIEAERKEQNKSVLRSNRLKY